MQVKGLLATHALANNSLFRNFARHLAKGYRLKKGGDRLNLKNYSIEIGLKFS